ncbi:uncharacterized protein G2W53_000218 [Senna tora]|uniref:Uncharacterized protein n=1 Tax=Senna tora TaxID=362788 RepID=A0A834XHG4_9FABA|nr:uncharacterized protein G2W53_000218 [Senna tora]
MIIICGKENLKSLLEDKWEDLLRVDDDADENTGQERDAQDTGLITN